MNDSLLTISVEFADGRAWCRPGGNLRGRVRIKAGTEWRADYIDLVIFWRTEGMGTEDKGIVWKETPINGGQSVPADFDHPFAVELPQIPWSFRGHHIKIRWFVGVYANPKPGAEIGREFEVAVHPDTSHVAVGDEEYLFDEEDEDEEEEVEEASDSDDRAGRDRRSPPPRGTIASSLNPPAPPDIAPPD